MAARSSNWCGTKQLDSEFDAETWLRQLVEQGKAKFVVGQLEQGSHLHLQFYIQRGTRTRLGTMKDEICDKTHWEPARGSPEDNIKYCTKTDTRVAGPWSFGTAIRRGQRTDLESAIDMIKEGAPLRMVAMKCSEAFVKFHKGLTALDTLVRSNGPRDIVATGPEVWVFWGPTGVGKSRKAYEQWPDAYRKTTSDKWWDGYRGQDTVIFDDFKGSSMKLHDFQMIIDRYPVQVEVKGSYIDLSAFRYVFTSISIPETGTPGGQTPKAQRCDASRVLRGAWPTHSHGLAAPEQSWVDAWNSHPPE